LSGKGVWPLNVDVRVQYDGASPVILPVEMVSDTTVVAGALGLPAPNFVYPNANDYGYGLFMLDQRSVDWLLSHPAAQWSTGSAPSSAFLRAMIWGSLWDLVRDARLDPRRYVDAALAALPAEKDEQIAARLLGRVARAAESYFSREDTEGTEIRNIESVLLAGASDTAKSYGLRK